MSICHKRTPETINTWLRKNADGLRIKKVGAGLYLLYNRFVRDKTARVVYLGSLGDCRVAIVGYIKRCEKRMANT